jgi:hypothetical protein
MLRVIRVWLPFALCCASGPASEAKWKLPPLDGEVSGELAATLFADAPRIRWKLALRTEQPRERHVAFEVEGRGLRVRGEARLDPRGEGTWRITSAEIDLADWFWRVASQMGADYATATGGGALQVTADGTWRDGQLGGRANLSLREGSVTHPGFALEGISVDVEVVDLAAPRTAPAQVFTWRSGRYDVVPLGVGRVEFELAAEELRVTSALIDVFGGELQIPSLVVSTQRPEFSVEARMVGIAVDQILFLLPPVLSEAKGRLDGNVALRRDASGIQIGNGRLTLREGETADLRLAVKPGWLTTSLPPDIAKNFPAFRKLETGEIPIRARSLEVTFTPLGDAAGRTAWVHLVGGPSDPQLTAPLDLNLAVRGPLEELVKIGADLGTDSRLKFSGAK